MRHSILSLTLLIITSLLFIKCKKDETTKPSDDFSDYTFEEPNFTGNTFYIDPINGKRDGDGSLNNPFRTLQEVVEDGNIQYYEHSENNNPNSELVLVNENAPIKGGDKIILKDGYHGFLSINRFMFKEWLTIEAEEGHTPVFSRIQLNGAFKNIYLKNLTIKKDAYDGDGNYWDADAINHNSSACLHIASSDFHGRGSSVKINGLTIKTTNDISAWTASEWVEKAAAGISLRDVKDIEISNCDISNISMGITIEYFSDNSRVINNSIKNYCLDGARIISNNVLFENNTIAGCYKVNDNHDDAIQSYSRGDDNSPGTGVLYNNVIRGNLIIGVLDPSHPLAGTPQGIGCFDGFFDGWTIENNVIIINHYHGISFYGMRNSKIANNTVIDQIPGDDLSPWIMVTDHKSGTKSSNCLVANNIVMRSVSAEGDNVTESNNFIIGGGNYDVLSDIFSNSSEYNCHLLNNSFTIENIIDKGTEIEGLISSQVDKDNNPRTLPPDLGAYEAN